VASVCGPDLPRLEDDSDLVLSADTPWVAVPYAGGMVGQGIRALWAEPRPPHAPRRVWRDWALFVVVVLWSLVEAGLRGDLTWRPVAFGVSLVIAFALLWRRTHPLAAVVVAFGTVLVFDAARVLGFDATGLVSIAALLVLPYSLFRWGAGREAAIGLGVILAWLGVTHVADPTAAAEVVAGYGFFLFSAARGASIRYHANSRVREIEEASSVSATCSPASSTTRWATTSRPSPSTPRPAGHSRPPNRTEPWLS
jgi:hypothetical protein